MARKSAKTGSSYSYFKQLFTDNPQWLKEKSNSIMLARYRADHSLAEDAEVEKKVLNNLANLKSVMRKKLRKRGRKPGSANAASSAGPSGSKLESLEIAIDDCLSTARMLNSKGLEDVITYLRRARNRVVWMLGEK